VAVQKKRRDVGKWIARFFCACFAFIGGLPLLAAGLARTSYVRHKAALVVQDLLRQELEVTAEFEIEVHTLPPAIALNAVKVPSTKPGDAFLQIDRILVKPRLFSLIGGRLDVGDIEIERPRIHAVIRDGQLSNLHYKLPKSKKKTTPPSRFPPFHTLALSEVTVLLELPTEKVQLLVDDFDLDLTGSTGPAYDAALNVASAKVFRERKAEDGQPITDEDSVCHLSARVHYSDNTILIRSLDLLANLDANPRADGYTSCKADIDPENKLSLKVTRLHINPQTKDFPTIFGHIAAEIPTRIASRIAPGVPTLQGDVGLDIDLTINNIKELPIVRGKLTGHHVMLDKQYAIFENLDGEIETTSKEVRLKRAKVAYADGTVILKNAVVQPLSAGIPVHVEEVEIQKLRFPGLMRDVGVTKHTVVEWTFDSGWLRNFHGYVIDPKKKGPSLLGDLYVNTSGFEIFDKGWDHPNRSHVIAVNHAIVRGQFGVEPDAIVFRKVIADFGHSHLNVPNVEIGLHKSLGIDINSATVVELGDISPISNVKLAGRLSIQGRVHGVQSNPTIEGEIRGTNFVLGDLPLADNLRGRAHFIPNVLNFTQLTAIKGKSTIDIPMVRLDFDRPSGMQVDAQASTNKANLRDILSMFKFEDDPRFEDIKGLASGTANIRFEQGGPADICKTGVISVRTQAEVSNLELMGEKFSSGNVDLDYIWFDRDAQENGIHATVRSVVLHKGTGTLFGAGTIRQGAKIQGHFVAQGLPVSSLNGLGSVGSSLDGNVNATGEVGGTLSQLFAHANVQISPIRIGQKLLPSSNFTFALTPLKPRVSPWTGKLSACKEPIPRPFSMSEHKQDLALGVMQLDGQLFGNQIILQGLKTTRQRSKQLWGNVLFKQLDLGAFAQLIPSFQTSDAPPQGRLTGALQINSFPIDHPEKAIVALNINQLDILQSGRKLKLASTPTLPQTISVNIANNTLFLKPFRLQATSANNVSGVFQLSGNIKQLATTKDLDLSLQLAPLDLSFLREITPKIESASGVLEGAFTVKGTVNDPIPSGNLVVRRGAIELRGSPITLDNLNLIASVDKREIRISNATASAGGGTLTLSAKAPLNGFELGTVSAKLNADNVSIPAIEGVDMAVDAALSATWVPTPANAKTQNKVLVQGDIAFERFLYTRPITISVNLDSLAKRGRRTNISVYDPDDDFLQFQVAIRAKQPLRFRNNLLEAEVALNSDALFLSGTNQRFGLTGQLRLEKGGHLRLRSNDFEIRQGTIRFDDPTRIAPRVDMSASTEYRRYGSSSSLATGATGAGTASPTGATGGSWRITLHAHGDADNLKLDLTSEPNLAQEDIVLLLTAGMTRAELAQLQASNLGSTAALEALSVLSGADSAVKTVIPIIDDFRFGSSYSTRTGRTDPTVTIGKRISTQVRANITTGLSENRDVRSNVEWQLTPKTSILGNYDNLNDVTARGLGNLGADFRIRLEF
jgi:translocation and assembly module TamB